MNNHTEIIKEMVRLENFSDGVFSIVVTLLALELKIPEHTTPANLKTVLLDSWPAYISFFTSFFSVLIMWVNHHGIFKFLKTADNTFLYLNGIMLCLVTIVPFTTALLSQYFNTVSAPLVLAIYSGLFILINISFNWLWYVVRTHKTLIKSDTDKKVIDKMTIAYGLGFPGYLIAFTAAFISPFLSLIICFLLWVIWALLMTKIKVN